MNKELSLKEIQKVGNDILLFIRDVCIKNNIVFYLAYGTALGAVRHQGFIPWDDDIDIIMTRDNYKKFQAVMAKYKESRYRLLSLETEPNYYMPFPKVIDSKTVWHQLDSRDDLMTLGVYVDVFILDNVPMDEKARRRFVRRQSFLWDLYMSVQQSRHYTTWDPKTVLKRFMFFFAKRINPRMFSLLLDRYAQQYSDSESSDCGSLFFSGNILPKSVYGVGHHALFEGAEYLIPKEWDNYLTFFYGDYMQLPPEEQRVSHHTHHAYFIEE